MDFAAGNHLAQKDCGEPSWLAFWQVDERIYWLYKPRFEGDTIGEELNPRHALLTSVWEIPPERDQRHPNPFPIELPTRCIFSVLDGRKGVVLDPYCGIGTTLVAAASNYAPCLLLAGKTATAGNVLLVNTAPVSIEVGLEAIGVGKARSVRVRLLRERDAPTYAEQKPDSLVRVPLPPYGVGVVQFVW